jgi:hypothetical protein
MLSKICIPELHLESVQDLRARSKVKRNPIRLLMAQGAEDPLS